MIENNHASAARSTNPLAEPVVADGSGTDSGSGFGTVSGLTVLIPAYKPSKELIPLIRSILETRFGWVVVVDDGSGAEFNAIFQELDAMEGVTVLHHAVNLGKGVALRYGLNHIAVYAPETQGVITADADGQHLPEDILKVGHKLLENPNVLVMGSRNFQGDVPLRSRFGNVMTQYVFKVFAPSKLSDTQTGLRGIPLSLIPNLLVVPGDRYEYEMRMLIELKMQGVEMVECPIETVYEDDNESSHFRAVRDSMKIYSVFTRFLLISFTTFLIDVIVFSIVDWTTNNIALSMVIARLVAGVYQFTVVRGFVFKSNRSVVSSAFWYALLVAASGLVSYALITAATLVSSVDVVVLKVVSETLLIIANFSIQRLLIFPMTSSRTSDSA
tara:strand:+ start:242225 stop:243382 length:1158 start_codon:yes stop_codon:yes gene_type:complete